MKNEKRNESNAVVKKSYIIHDDNGISLEEFSTSGDLSMISKTDITINITDAESILKDKDHNRYSDSFMVDDISALMHKLGMHNKIISFNSYENKDNVDRYTRIKNILDYFNNHQEYKNSVILIDSYISKLDYPPEKYYLYEIDKDDTKTLLPVDKILLKSNEELVKLGFININNLVGYECKEAFIYNNDAAKAIITEIKKDEYKIYGKIS